MHKILMSIESKEPVTGLILQRVAEDVADGIKEGDGFYNGQNYTWHVSGEIETGDGDDDNEINFSSNNYTSEQIYTIAESYGYKVEETQAGELFVLEVINEINEIEYEFESKTGDIYTKVYSTGRDDEN
jgi:phosphomannomutase